MAGVFVIAEAGSNWRMGTAERDLAMARSLIDAAVDAGADAVKFQTFRSRTVYVSDAGASDYLAELGIEKSINQIFDDLEMPYELLPRLAEYCADQGIEFMSTPFSTEDAAAVDPFVSRHKIASYELTHARLVEDLARRRKPMIMSTGAGSEDDVAFGLDVARSAGASDITLMQCTARYPAPPDAMQLRSIPYMRRRFGTPVGLSDHSADPLTAPTAAVALGAAAIEKHFTIDRRLPGPDHAFAVEPHELAAMVRAIRDTEAMLGSEVKAVHPVEEELRDFAVRAIQATRDIHVGEMFVEGENIDVLRPGHRRRGLHPRHLGEVTGRTATRDIHRGDGVCAADVAEEPNL